MMHKHSKAILGIETSCDETAAAVVFESGRVGGSVLSSQHEVHGKFGGVVPELAARRHIELIEMMVDGVMKQANIGWSDLGAVAVTQGPGLAGALLVGVSFAKSLAFSLRIPLVTVNHLEGHLATAWLERPNFPHSCVALVVSGGHTHLYAVSQQRIDRQLGRTLDDAAGEVFDKGAKMLGLEYPGGPALDRLATMGDALAIPFPRPGSKLPGLDFSFSGLKTALLYYLRDAKQAGREISRPNIAAGYQEAIVDVLVEKSFQAVRATGINALAVVGGVSANSRLRARLQERAQAEGIELVIPRVSYCTDNAVMVASAALPRYRRGEFASWEAEADPELAIGMTHQ